MIIWCISSRKTYAQKDFDHRSIGYCRHFGIQLVRKPRFRACRRGIGRAGFTRIRHEAAQDQSDNTVDLERPPFLDELN